MGSSGMNAEYMGHLVICSPELHNSDMTNYNCKLFFVFMLVISTLTPSDSTTTTPVVTTTTQATTTPVVTTTTPAATTTTSGVPSMCAPVCFGNSYDDETAPLNEHHSLNRQPYSLASERMEPLAISSIINLQVNATMLELLLLSLFK